MEKFSFESIPTKYRIITFYYLLNYFLKRTKQKQQKFIKNYKKKQILHKLSVYLIT